MKNPTPLLLDTSAVTLLLDAFEELESRVAEEQETIEPWDTLGLANAQKLLQRISLLQASVTAAYLEAQGHPA